MAELSAERTDMHSVVAHATDAVRGLAEESNTPLELDVPTGMYAEIDPRRVERIVRNLVANAIDHGECRPVRITLGCDERCVAVLVRDHGLGLRPGEAGLVFNRFWRADSSRARRSGGTGLGLSISLEDARLHSGWLQAWGEPGRGAAFRLTLPRQVGTELEGSPLPLVPTDEPLDEPPRRQSEQLDDTAHGEARIGELPVVRPADPGSGPDGYYGAEQDTEAASTGEPR
jgi:two-component system sensor histidine kinase MtrB